MAVPQVSQCKYMKLSIMIFYHVLFCFIAEILHILTITYTQNEVNESMDSYQ